MKRLLFIVLMAVAATGANAQFKGSVDVRYKLDPTLYTIGFNFSRVCDQLGVDKEEFGKLLATEWWGEEREFSLYMLTDEGGGFTSEYNLTQDGSKAKSRNERIWSCSITPPMADWNRLDFNLSVYTDEDGYPLLKVGESCNAVWALEYQGKVATFDITLNMAEQDGPALPLSSLEKVGEKVLSGNLDFSAGDHLDFDLKGVAALFGNDVDGSNLQIFATTDAENQMITGCNNAQSLIDIKIDGMKCLNRKASAFYMVQYSGETVRVTVASDFFKGGQKTSGSVFLVADGKYYELILDIQFGDEYADQESFDIVKTEQMDVQLVWTENYFSYRNREDGRYGLISTDIDEAGIKALLGTNNPRLYAEQKDGDGVVYTSRYNAAPGQGFWFTSGGGQLYRQYSNFRSLGAYYTDGSIKWYEVPSLELGDAFQLNLYLANPDNGKAVKYEISVCLVKELQTEGVAYVRSLPVGLTGSPDGIENLRSTPSPSRGAIYDLQGRRLMKAPEKGLYIQDGKKMMVK